MSFYLMIHLGVFFYDFMHGFEVYTLFYSFMIRGWRCNIFNLQFYFFKIDLKKKKHLDYLSNWDIYLLDHIGCK